MWASTFHCRLLNTYRCCSPKCNACALVSSVFQVLGINSVNPWHMQGPDPPDGGHRGKDWQLLPLESWHQKYIADNCKLILWSTRMWNLNASFWVAEWRCNPNRFSSIDIAVPMGHMLHPSHSSLFFMTLPLVMFSYSFTNIKLTSLLFPRALSFHPF